jgi:crotonobetainyl-CoA:carnitine CoA-transferase CaiB-like acyl-CoA transferase
MASSQADAQLGPPLADLQVIDLSRLVAGNQLTMLLGDFGADVIKVEQPGLGDTLRSWRTAGQDLYWKVYGRNKRSITLDLRRDIAREALLRLVSTADVLVESFRPGGLEALQLGVPQLHERNPRLVIIRISGWGGTGSLHERPGFGTLVEAMSGFAVMNGFPDREPALPPIALADMVAGTYGAFAAAVAVARARDSGQGQVIDLSLFESLFSILGPTAAVFKATGSAPTRWGNRSPTSAPRNIYRTADDQWIAVSATTQAMTERLFNAMGRPDLIADARFTDNSARVQHVMELDAIIAAYFERDDTKQHMARLEAAGVTAVPVCDVGDLLSGEYFSTREVVVDVGATDGPAVAMHNVVPRLSGSPGAIRHAGPALGEHNEDVLRPIMSDAEWTELMS